MKKFVLDTNLYVHAFRNAEGARELQDFYRSFAPSTYLSSIVLHELLVGANTDARVRSIPKSLINDYLLAASCRESGATLITDNISDFAAIRRHIRLEYMRPWPG